MFLLEKVITKMDYQFTKSISEKYCIRLPKMNGWAIIFLDEKNGTLSVHSDFGNWAYSWTSIGQPSLKHFLIECDTDYVSSKFVGSKRFVNVEETIKAIKADIIEKRKNNECTEEEARRAIDELGYLDCGEATVNDFCSSIALECSHLYKVYNYDMADVPIRTEYESGINCFMKAIWPVFIEILKEEIQKGDDNVLKLVPVETSQHS